MAIQTLIENLLFEEEGSALDFKSEQYRFSGATPEDKSELLKDVLAFANSWRRTDAYILIGVKEVKGGRSEVLGIHDHLDDAQLQQFINSKTQRPIEFSYKTIPFESTQIGVIHIPIQRKPIYIKKDFGKIQKDTVYIRRGSSTAIASIDEVSTMGAETSPINEILALEAYLISGEHDEVIEKQIKCKVVNASIPSDKDFPDYGVEYITMGGRSIPLGNISGYDKNYTRKLAKYMQAHSRVASLKIGIKNLSSISARDVKITFHLPNEKNESIACTRNDLPSFPERTSLLNLPSFRTTNNVKVKQTPQGWQITCFLGKIQPKDITLSDCFCLGVTSSKSLNIDAEIFSDDLPEPIKQQLHIDFEVEQRIYSVDDF
ncbi:MAG: ATP-binding protein [Gammaproteobacteria bacterium]|nr:ATP-binding protein [Gammaproteobacteria bacterium]